MIKIEVKDGDKIILEDLIVDAQSFKGLYEKIMFLANNYPKKVVKGLRGCVAGKNRWGFKGLVSVEKLEIIDFSFYFKLVELMGYDIILRPRAVAYEMKSSRTHHIYVNNRFPRFKVWISKKKNYKDFRVEIHDDILGSESALDHSDFIVSIIGIGLARIYNQGALMEVVRELRKELGYEFYLNRELRTRVFFRKDLERLGVKLLK